MISSLETQRKNMFRENVCLLIQLKLNDLLVHLVSILPIRPYQKQYVSVTICMTQFYDQLITVIFINPSNREVALFVEK